MTIWVFPFKGDFNSFLEKVLAWLVLMASLFGLGALLIIFLSILLMPRIIEWTPKYGDHVYIQEGFYEGFDGIVTHATPNDLLTIEVPEIGTITNIPKQTVNPFNAEASNEVSNSSNH